jgi:hypothetical protein
MMDNFEGMNLGSAVGGHESPDSIENHEGNLDQIDEMYDNMNQFDYKLKTLKNQSFKK